MSRQPGVNDDRVDEVRRRLVRASLVATGGLAIGQVPYRSPEIKSFFGVPAAYAQASQPMCGVIEVTAGPMTSQLGPEQEFTISNDGGAAFTVTALTVDNPVFIVLAPTLPVTLDPGDSVALIVELDCSAAGQGTHTGELSLVAEGDGMTITCPTVALAGTCEAVCEVDPLTFDFGNVGAGDLATTTVTVTNSGDVAFDLSSVVSDNPLFTPVFTGPVTLDPGDSTMFDVEFDCATGGVQTAILTLTAANGFGTVDCPTIELAATCATAAECAVTPTDLAFSAPLGGSDSQVFTIENTGNAPLTVTGVNFINLNPPSNQFTVTDPFLPVIIFPDTSIAFTVQFDCTTGDQSGEIEIKNTSDFGPVDCGPITLDAVCVTNAGDGASDDANDGSDDDASDDAG